jgi:hypothetical protein
MEPKKTRKCNWFQEANFSQKWRNTPETLSKMNADSFIASGPAPCHGKISRKNATDIFSLRHRKEEKRLGERFIQLTSSPAGNQPSTIH